MKNLSRQVTAIIIMTVIFFGVAPQNLKAQTGYKLSTGKDVAIKILGSSNIHDWVMTSSATMESQGEFKFDDKNQLQSLHSFSFSVDAKSLKSEHESMDNRTYTTIKADKYPRITYKLISATITQAEKNKYLVKTTGDLTIAGATQAIAMTVTVIVNADNTLSCTGSEKLKLTDYKIDPPSFMLGAMKVTNDLTIQFNLLYNKSTQLITKN
jgi:polyisoprenoid-binding protein YceI